MHNAADLRLLTEEFYASRNKEKPEDAIEAIVERFAPDGCFQILGTDRLGAFTQKCEGTDALRAAATQLVEAWDLSGLDNVRIYTDGDTTLTHRKGMVRFIPTGHAFETEFLDRMTFRGDKIVEYVQFVDTLGVAEAAGLVRFA